MTRVRLAVVGRLAVGAALWLAAALASEASAQQRPGGRAQEARPSTARTAPPRAGEGDANADLSITARVTADSLRFEKVPNTRVEFTGRPKRDTVWEAERENLPPEVRPGVTYRNIGITLRITSVFADIDRIVAEALGEVPVSDDAQPSPTTPAPTATPPQAPTTPPASPSTSKTPPANSGANATRRRPAHRGRGE